MPPKITKDEKTVAAVERALTILDVFDRDDNALSLAELSDRSGVHKSTILRLALTLERFGYLARGGDGAFRIGSKPFFIGAHYQRWIQPADVILPALNELAALTGENSSFMVRQGSVRICLYRVASRHAVRDQMFPGDVFPVDKGAAGKIMLAFAKPRDRAFEKVRREMIAITHAELTPDVSAIAAPVFGSDSELAGSISVSGPQYRFDAEAMKHASSHLLDAARSLSLAIGADPSLFQTSRSVRRRME